MSKSPKPSRRRAARPNASVDLQPTLAELRARHDGWTRARQTGFLQALAESGCVEEACRSVGMAKQSAYRLRARIDAQGFRIAWDKALDYAIRRLSDACLARALHGEARPIFYKGEQVGERRVYDNRLAMFLLRYRDPLRYAASLDQMVYSGQTEAAAIDLVKAIHRVDAEADGLWETDAEPETVPYTIEPIADALARAKEEALIAGNGPIHGSYERRRRLEEARTARRLKESGHASGEEWGRARRAEREAEEEAEMAILETLISDDLEEADSAGDVPSPSSPSAAPPSDANPETGPSGRRAAAPRPMASGPSPAPIRS